MSALNEPVFGRRKKTLAAVVSVLLAMTTLAAMVLAILHFYPRDPGQTKEAPMPHGPGVVINSMTWSWDLSRDEQQILTLANYERIQPGMTYDELMAVLELPLDRWRPADIEYLAADSPVELTWNATGDRNNQRSITVKLKGKTVVSKSQKGLS
jgi:hypothetical protein